MRRAIKVFTILSSVLGVLFWMLLLGNDNPYTDIMFGLAYILLGLSALIAIVFTFRTIFQDKNLLKKTIIGISAFAGILLASYFIALTSDSKDHLMVDVGLFSFYILVIIASSLMILFGISKSFTKK